jgi:hypothetical protein
MTNGTVKKRRAYNYYVEYPSALFLRLFRAFLDHARSSRWTRVCSGLCRP